MDKQIYENEITQYLLGFLPEEEAVRFDELSFTDDEFAEALKVAEKELVDGFVRGELSGQELERFTSFYLTSPLRREKVRFAEAFQVFAERTLAQEEASSPEVPSKSPRTLSGLLSALKIFTVPRPALQWGLASTMLLMLLAGGWLVFENIRLRQLTSQAQAEGAELQRRKRELEMQLASERSPTPVVTPIASSTPAAEGATSVIAQLSDGGSRVMLDREGKLAGVDRLPPAYQRMVKEVLTDQRLEESSALAGLNRTASSLMGGDEQGNKFLVTEPVGKVMLADRPPFRWSPLTGATGYVVEVYDEKFNLVATSSQLTGNSWTAPQPFKRGGVYPWQVKAIKDGQEFRSPRPPAPQAKFRILDQAKANELAEARRAYASSHLVLALLYAQAGLVDEAEQELRALQKNNPNSAIVRRLLASVQAVRH
jgi:hypothetical protein